MTSGLPWLVSVAAWWTLGELGMLHIAHAAGGLGLLAVWVALTGLLADGLRRWPPDRRRLVRLCTIACTLSVALAWCALRVRWTALLPLLAFVGAAAMAYVAELSRRQRPTGHARPPSGRCTSSGRLRVMALATRWSMWTMLASFAPMTLWCGDAGWSPADSWAAHLAAIWGPPMLVWGIRVAMGVEVSRAGLAWAATAAMITGTVASICLPGSRGLMLAGLWQALAWGLCASRRDDKGKAACGTVPPDSAIGALVLAVGVALLGVALDAWGPAALRWIYAGLGVVVLAASLCWFAEDRGRPEALSARV